MFSVPSALLCITFFPPSNSPQVKLNLNFSTTLCPKGRGRKLDTTHLGLGFQLRYPNATKG